MTPGYREAIATYQRIMDETDWIDKILHRLWSVPGIDDTELVRLQGFINDVRENARCPRCDNRRYVLREHDNHGHVTTAIDYCWVCNKDWKQYPDAYRAGLEKHRGVLFQQ